MATYTTFLQQMFKRLPSTLLGPLQIPIMGLSKLFGFEDPTFFGALTGMDSSPLNSMFNKYTGSGLTGAEHEQNAFAASEAAKQRQWSEQMSNTAYQRSTADMQAAGVNPALMYGGSAGPATTPSGSAASPGSSQNGANLSELLQLIGFKTQMEKVKAETENINAETNKTETETEGVRINNEFLSATQDCRREAIESQNRLNDARYDEVREGIRKTHQEIQKLVKETDNEEARKGLIEAEKLLKYANVREINALLPYKKLLMDAQTAQERATAGLAIAQEAYQRRLIDNGYVDAMFDQIAIANGIAKDNKKLLDTKVKLRDGTLFKDANTGIAPLDWMLNADKTVATSMLQGLALIVDNFNPIAGMLK